MNFSNAELINMIYILGASDKNPLLATRLYHEKYPDRRQPDRRAFRKLMERFERTGSVAYDKNSRRKFVRTEENELNVLLAITENPHIGQRPLAHQVDIARSSVQRVIRAHKMHPYHMQLLQELNDEDYDRRVVFCEWVQTKMREQRNFANDVLFCDEATFHKNGNVNRHNFHYYATTNPHFVRMHSQNRWSLNVWGGVVGEYMIGPYFFDVRVTGGVYLNFLRNNLPPLIGHVPQAIRERMWFLHDGAPVHSTRLIIDYLNETYGEQWIGRGGPVLWPPRSPDLTKMDFSIWGYVKDQVYKIPPTTIEDMKNRIRNCFQNITVEMCRNLSESFERRVEICLQVNGGHFEHLIK